MASDPNLWATVDELLGGALLQRDSVLEDALKTSAAAGLPEIQVTPLQGRLLHLLAKLVSARRILELGTLGGYSTICLGRALAPGGRLISLELEAKHAELARQNVARAGLSDCIEVRLGPALQLLPGLLTEGLAPFDMIFIDADKTGTPDYFRWALKLSRRGTLIVVDNVVRKGALADKQSTDPAVCAMREFVEMAGSEPAVTATAIQTVGSKGYDGFVLALVTADCA